VKRELLFSFIGHIGLVAVLGIGGTLRLSRPQPRPQVFAVKLVNPGTPEPAEEPGKASVVQPKPRPRKRPETKPEPKPRKKESVVRKRGLGARIEGADALGYAYYLNIILAKIADNWYNPYAGQSVEFRATVYFVVEQDGTVKEVKLERGSGNGAYDASCERALLVTQKLPPLPPEFTGPRLKLHLEFEQVP
jgi:TonB family protein